MPPQPGQGELHIDHYLTQVAVAWQQEQKDFIADKIFPIVPVNNKSDFYAVYDKGYFYRDEVTPRPYGGRPGVAGYKIGKGHYICEEDALEDKIDDRDRENADQPLDPEMASTMMLQGQMAIHRDREWCTKFLAADVWSVEWKGVASGAKEDDNEFLEWLQEGSKPIPFLRKLRWKVKSGTGYSPNNLVLGVDAYEALANHPEVLDRIKYTQRGVVTTEILASLIDIDQVLVPSAVMNSAPEGAADDINFIANTTDALMAYAAPAPSIKAPTAGYTFAWTKLIPGATNAFGGVIERGREELAHSDVIQIRAAADQNLVASDLGVFISACCPAST